MSPGESFEVVTLGGGCFWCLQPAFRELRGVERVVVGYSGGKVKDPTYEQVCTEGTGHAEVVQVAFDRNVISFDEILRVFFTIHDPTTLNRQGNDTGAQYRSAIFYHTPEQKATSKHLVKELEAARLWDDPFVTEVTPFAEFYVGEDYHQDYFKKNPWAGYCRAIIAPKVAKFRKEWREKLKVGTTPGLKSGSR